MVEKDSGDIPYFAVFRCAAYVRRHIIIFALPAKIIDLVVLPYE